MSDTTDPPALSRVGAINDDGVGGLQYQWWLFPKDYSAEGVFGQYIYVMPRHKLV